MTGMEVDPEKRRARVEAGVRWQQVIDAAGKHGLAPLNGASPVVGVVSYTLGGGLGPLGRAFGWAADHVHAFELVTADGTVRRVSADQHPGLFWAVRGSKGNFGVVTALEFDLMPVATIFGGAMYFAGEVASDVLHAYQSWTKTLPDEMTSSVALLRLPPLPEVPEPLRGKLSVAVRISYLGSTEDGEQLIAPLRAVGPRLIDTVAEMPYTAVAAIHMDPTDPLPGYDRTTALRDFDAEAVEAVLELAGPDVDTPMLLVEIRHLGGALARRPKHPNAVGNRNAAYSFLTVAVGPPDEAATLLAAQEELINALEPWSTGGMLLNFIAGHVPADRHREAWSPEDYTRLRALKATYDPYNLFRVNVNIPPEDVVEWS
jgi:FAD binding domain/Berberine and berberine like